VFERSTHSFRPLAPADRDRIMESRLRVRSARAGETVAQVLGRGGSIWKAVQAEVANGVQSDTRLEPGWPVKVAIAERYRGVSAPAPASR
jgi:predicted Zn-dependent protease